MEVGMTGMPSYSCHVPRIRVMPSFVASRFCVGTFPRVTITSDRIEEICCFTKPMQDSDLVGLGIAVVRRTALDDIADVDLGAFYPHAFR